MNSLERRMLKAYDSTNKRQRAEGAAWYNEASTFAAGLANASHGLYTREQVAGVIAVTSPVQPWSSQKVFVPLILRHHAAGGDADEVSFGFKSSGRKAWRILTGDFSVISGPKVSAFFCAILGSTDSVTVDRWIARIAYGNKVDSVNNRQYEEVATAIRSAAKRRGIPARDFQAILWVWARETRCGEQQILF